MNTQTTQFDNVRVTLTAHRDAVQQLLLATVEVSEDEQTRQLESAPATIAVVIDRSGSMSGGKLQITCEAVARLIRSLNPNDLMAVVTYDHEVDLVCGLQAPSESLARQVEHIPAGGSTNLYGGWVAGAKLVGRGGRVILLSDGLANHGRYQDARDLERHAALSYQRFGVTTTTIGIGEDYDEALMAGMARAGGGGHYFAHTAEAIMDAFSQERFSVGAISVAHVSIKIGGLVKQLGHFWEGETKSTVLQISNLVEQGSIRFTRSGAAGAETHPLSMPKEFGHSDNATMEALMERAAELQEQVLGVRHPAAAQELGAQVRTLALALLTHPLADTPAVASLIENLNQTRQKLQELERRFDEREATVLRKRGMQTSHILRERAKAFSSYQEDEDFVGTMHEAAMAPSARPRVLVPDDNLTNLAPLNMWRSWLAVPIELKGRTIHVAMAKPRDGFTISEMEKWTGMRVRPLSYRVSSDEIADMLDDWERKKMPRP